MPFYNPIRLGASGGAAEDFTVDRVLDLMTMTVLISLERQVVLVIGEHLQ